MTEEGPTQEEIEAFREYCRQCAEEVATWPEWKRNALGPIND